MAGWLACLGGCDYTGWLTSERCLGESKEDASGTKIKRAAAQSSIDRCSSLNRFQFQCPAWQATLSAEFGCQNAREKGASFNIN